MCNACPDCCLCAYFGLQITAQRLWHVLTDQQLAHILQIGRSIKHEKADHQLVSMIHFTIGLLTFFRYRLVQPPVLVCAVVQKILMDGRHLIFKLGLQVIDNLCVAFDGVNL